MLAWRLLWQGHHNAVITLCQEQHQETVEHPEVLHMTLEAAEMTVW